MNKHVVWVVALCSVGLMAGAGCGKKDKDGKEKQGKVTTDPTKPEPTKPAPTKPEPPKKLTGEERAARYKECMGYWSAKDEAKFKSCLAPEVSLDNVNSGMPATTGPDALVAGVKAFWTGFPDIKVEPQLVLVNGNTIVSIDLVMGTHTAEWNQIPATGKKVGYLMSHVIEINDAGQATKVTVYMDPATLMGQLGVSPAPARPAMEKGWPSSLVVVAKGSPEETANLAAAKAGVEKVNAHDVDGFLASLSDDSMESDQTAPADTKGKEGIKKGLSAFFNGFPDLKLGVTRELAAGDYVVNIGTFTGTNSKPIPDWGIKKATNKPVQVGYLEVMKVTGGKISETWRFHSGMAMAIQLGLMEPPGGAAPAGAPSAKPDDVKKDDAKKDDVMKDDVKAKPELKSPIKAPKQPE
jgi:predicted ester cyclase